MEGTVPTTKPTPKMPTATPVTQTKLSLPPLGLSLLSPEEAAHCRAILLANEVKEEHHEFIALMKQKIENEKNLRAQFIELYGDGAEEMLMWTYE